MEKVIDILYKMSSELYSFLNGCGKFEGGSYWSFGKIFDNETEAATYLQIAAKEEVIPLDCRSDSVDANIKQVVRDRIYWYIKDFYIKSDKNNEFLLMLGFSINLYYIVGLYSVFGKFELNTILSFVESEDVKNYAELMNEFLYSKITDGIIEEIPCLESQENTNHYLSNMVTNYPDFKFGWIYLCLEKGIQFYRSNGDNIEVYEYKAKVGSELFSHILGLNPLDSVKAKTVDGKIKVLRPALLSAFGMGIPKIKTINKDTFYSGLAPAIIESEGNKAAVTFTDIREQTAAFLGVDTIVTTDENPLKYAVKLFNIVDEQKNELENKNVELKRLNEQRRNMIDHLAHSWGNECYPEIVKKAAEELLKKGNHSLANRLFKAYNSENNLMGEIIFLQSAMADEPERLQNIFSNSFYISGKGNKELKIQTILEDALEILVFSLLNYDGNKEKRKICREHLCVKHTLKELADDYSRRFENEAKKESFVEWFHKNIFPVTIKTDNIWEKINFGKSEYGKIVIKNIFTELFTNVLFHGKTTCEILLESDKDKMYMIMRNQISGSKKGTGKGLRSIKEIVAKLNYNTSVSDDEGVKYSLITDSVFETKITFAKELMYIEEW